MSHFLSKFSMPSQNKAKSLDLLWGKSDAIYNKRKRCFLAKLPISQRPRRNRKSAAVRELVAETSLSPSHLVYPLFVCEGGKIRDPIKSMPGQFRWSVDLLLEEIAESMKLGIRAFALFPVINDSLKTPGAEESFNPKGLLPECVKKIKTQFPESVVITDVALDPYSSDGHDGIVKNGKILNDETNEVLAKMAVMQAQAGTDIVAPSDMMDGRIGVIRRALDAAGFSDTSILSYAVKYASGYYGPFRDALDSAPRHGDKKTYQMDYRNRREALREVQLDINEGADIVMVKPGLAYLDVVREVKNYSKVPVAVYNVSGEYSMIKAAGSLKMIDAEKVMLETLYAFRRAGADIIFTYFAKEFAEYFKKSSAQ